MGKEMNLEDSLYHIHLEGYSSSRFTLETYDLPQLYILGHIYNTRDVFPPVK